LVIILIISLGAQDFAANFIGKRIKLGYFARSISPNKTLAGSIAGFFCGMLVIMIGARFVDIQVDVGFFAIVLLLGQFGDLFYSNFKRLYNKKDYSGFLGKKGGILDRIDSLIFSVLYIGVHSALLV
jgi:phosphatidate cytidylyltransferase